MSLLDQAIQDAALIAGGEFSSSVQLIAIGGQTATLQALGNKIGRKLDTETGVVVNTKNASVVVSEGSLRSANPNYPIRNDKSEVKMIGHKVNVKDSTGTTRNYIVQENIPDEALGLITLILGDFQP